MNNHADKTYYDFVNELEELYLEIKILKKQIKDLERIKNKTHKSLKKNNRKRIEEC